MESREPEVTTEITVVGGNRYRVVGAAEDVERAVLDAARGSIMELAWFQDAATNERIGVNPQHVVLIRVKDA